MRAPAPDADEAPAGTVEDFDFSFSPEVITLEFEQGDIVKIIAPDQVEQEDMLDSVGFNDDMEAMIGQVHEIESEDYAHGYIVYHLKNCEWVFCPEWLELIQRTKNPRLTEEDFNSAFN